VYTRHADEDTVEVLHEYQGRRQFRVGGATRATNLETGQGDELHGVGTFEQLFDDDSLGRKSLIVCEDE
jgi:hypothetical protein